MSGQIHDVTLENLAGSPREVLGAVFWELADEPEDLDARFHKEEWFSSTLLEWGACGKLALDEEGDPIGFAQYAPPSLFPRLERYPAGRVSPDAVYLAYCYVSPAHRGRAVGSDLVRSVARELVDRGYRALEALGETDSSGGWVLPAAFLARNRFAIVRDDPAAPLWRLELLQAPAMAEEASAAVTLPPT